MKKTNKKYKCAKVWQFPDFKYSSSVGYNYSHDCSGCECGDGYCRCSRIVDIRIIKVSLHHLVNEISSSFISSRIPIEDYETKSEFNEEFFSYCIWRLAVIHKMWEEHNWYVSTCGGYYGEEIDGVAIENHNFKQDIEELAALSPQERIKFVLHEEYGFILDSLKDKKFEEIKVKKSDLVVGNDTYHKKVNRGTYSKESYDLPIGIYLKDGEKYRLIDGYHRYIDLADEEVSIIAAI